MKRRKFKSYKLWRDKSIDCFEQMGSIIHWKKLDEDQFAEQLKLKLLEEAEEVCQAKTKESLLEELGDLLEIITSFGELHGMSLEDIIHLQNKKYQERGGFQGRKYVTVAEHLIGSCGEKYCLNDPNKYPEIIE